MAPVDIANLTPSEFENLAFDLLQSAGLRNMVWRTPGADGGRDIEGQYLINDLSGAVTVQKWYVECKRYSSPIDWATLFAKIAHAEVHDANYLLLVTNNNPSPQCETRISEWNAVRGRVQVRVWRGYEFGRLLESYPAVAVKYGLRNTPTPIDAEFLPLLVEITKVAQASYVAMDFDQSPRPGLEMAGSLAELISLRMAQIRAHGKTFVADTLERVPDFDWLEWSGPIGAWEEVGIRAFLTAYRYYLGAKTVKVVAGGGGAQLEPIKCRGQPTPVVRESLAAIALWADIELGTFNDTNYSLTIRPRR